MAVFHDDNRHELLVRPGDQMIEVKIICLNDKDNIPSWCNREGSCQVVADWENVGIDLLTTMSLQGHHEQPWVRLAKVAYEIRGNGEDAESWVIPSEKNQIERWLEV